MTSQKEKVDLEIEKKVLDQNQKKKATQEKVALVLVTSQKEKVDLEIEKKVLNQNQNLAFQKHEAPLTENLAVVANSVLLAEMDLDLEQKVLQKKSLVLL